MTDLPDAAITAAWEVLHDVPGWPPYMVRAADYVAAESTPAMREQQLKALRAADAEADAMNRDVIRRALEAAAPHLTAAATAAERQRIISLASQLRATIPADHPLGAQASFADYLRVTDTP